MAAVGRTNERLRDTDGFRIESAEDEVGWVEEVWLGDSDEPRAAAVRTRDSKRGLLLAEEVVTVDREERWVVVPPRPALLELASPRLADLPRDPGANGRLSASWATTGTRLVPTPHRRPLLPALRRVHVEAPAFVAAERPLWQVVAMLYAFLACTVVLVIALAFAAAWLVGGSAY